MLVILLVLNMCSYVNIDELNEGMNDEDNKFEY